MGKFSITESVGFDKPARVSRNETTGEIVIEGVKYLGAESVNVNEDGSNNHYPLEGRQSSEHLYEGASIYLDHPDRSTPGAERSYAEKLGRLRGPFRHVEEGSHANLHLNPRHPLAEQIAWDAEHSPDSLGLSHNAQGTGEVAEGQTGRQITVTRVRSVDLVAAAATTSSLFESEAPMADTETPEVVEAAEVEAVEAEAPTPDVVDEPHPSAAQIKALEAKIEALEAEAAVTANWIARETLIAESNLPKSVLSEVFVEQVISAKDEETAKALLEDRRRVAFHQDPESGVAAPAPKQSEPSAFDAWIEAL